ncbi:MAG TPA: alpha/beta hydrolase [Vicinamibacterales bacterium]|nr:alpha/beta hydrolase [Vicinamibacterales bacterium]
MKRLLSVFALLLLFASPLRAASVDGLTIHSTSAGAGPATIIFVHGWTCDLSSWAAQLPEFSKKYRVIALDLPGHGASDVPKDGKFSMTLFARAVEAVRAEAGADKIVLVGHSMGAPVILQYALLYPTHAAGIVAADGPLDMRQFARALNGQKLPSLSGPEGLKARETMIRGMFTPRTPPALQQQILAMMLRTSEVTATGAMASIFAPDIRPDATTAVPALEILAGTGQAVNVDEARKSLPKFEQTQVNGTGHFVMMENPAEFNRRLADFLNRIRF